VTLAPLVADRADHDSAAFGGVEGVEDDRIREGLGREVNRALGGRDKGRVDRVKALFG
jgi:hypothetical protein